MKKTEKEKKYQKLVNSLSPKPKRINNAICAFLVGGSVGLLGELITNGLQNFFKISSEAAIVWMIIFFIFMASLLTVTHLFDDLVGFAKAGLIVPITGFAHSITSSALDYKNDGLITGLGSNFFKLAGCVLLYGMSSAFILVILKVIIYG